MRPLVVVGASEGALLREILELCPAAEQAMRASRRIRCQVKPYQAAALYWLAEEYNLSGSRIVEIGTFHGYSATIMAQAAPRAQITTLNPDWAEADVARSHLECCSGVTVVAMASWDFYPAAPLHIDMVFVDGDHKRAARDAAWWNRIGPGGLMLWHDYTPAGSPPVVAVVDGLVRALGKDSPDVLLVDDAGVGMAGIYNTGYLGWPGVKVR